MVVCQLSGGSCAGRSRRVGRKVTPGSVSSARLVLELITVDWSLITHVVCAARWGSGFSRALEVRPRLVSRPQKIITADLLDVDPAPNRTAVSQPGTVRMWPSSGCIVFAERDRHSPVVVVEHGDEF